MKTYDPIDKPEYSSIHVPRPEVPCTEPDMLNWQKTLPSERGELSVELDNGWYIVFWTDEFEDQQKSGFIIYDDEYQLVGATGEGTRLPERALKVFDEFYPLEKWPLTADPCTKIERRPDQAILRALEQSKQNMHWSMSWDDDEPICCSFRRPYPGDLTTE